MRTLLFMLLMLTAVMFAGCASHQADSSAMHRQHADVEVIDSHPWDIVEAARRDIAASNIRFAYVGGIAKYPPGIPTYRSAMELVQQYDSFMVGEAGCVMTMPTESQYEDARHYNMTMWRHITRPVLVKERVGDLFGDSDQQEEWISYWTREHWLVADAVADAQRDIEASNIQFAQVYYFVSSLPGLPDNGAEIINNSQYKTFPVGESGCVRTDNSKDENDILYARLYNMHMWQHVSSMKAKPDMMPE